MQDNELVREVQKIMNGEIIEDFMITQDRMLVMEGRICVPNVDDMRKAIIEEVFYGRKCRTPLYWDEVYERKLEDAELTEATSEKIKIIRDRLKTVEELYGYTKKGLRI